MVSQIRRKALLAVVLAAVLFSVVALSASSRMVSSADAAPAAQLSDGGAGGHASMLAR
jgi:hypothetical protein